ncbi:MAG TPA: hypothetical protein VEU62_06445 [Bryobacterales bacterium]|nr:hypothetical protein [Bryobacterales bacterium]
MAGGEAAPNSEAVFTGVRRQAGTGNPRRLVLVQPGHALLALVCPPAGSMPQAQVRNMEQMISPATPRNIAVIARTDFLPALPGPAGDATPQAFQAASRAIPILGLLMGLSYIGHAVWIFSGEAADLAAGCRDADVLFVDSALRANLAQGWDEVAAGTMRNANIFVHDRATFQLRVVRKVGQAADRIEFAPEVGPGSLPQ